MFDTHESNCCESSIMWYRDQRGDKYIAGTFYVFVFMTITFMFFGNKQGIVFSIFAAIVLFLSMMYVKYVGKKLTLTNLKDKNYYYREDEGAFTLEFENKGIPILSANLRVHMDPYLDPILIDREMVKNKVQANRKYGLVEVEVPFSVGFRQNLTLSLPFIAKQRGKARISVIELLINNPLGFGEVSLTFMQEYKQEAVVFPVTKQVNGHLSFSTQKEGETPLLFAIHENPLSPVGVRDYALGDHFKNIHWKATARKQTLQTKINEKASDTSLIISYNIAEGIGLRPDFEEQIERIAYLAQSFHKQDISFGLAINVRSYGETPFLYIPLGKGKDHMLRILEALAVITSFTMTTPYKKVLYSMQRMDVSNVLHLGSLNSEHSQIFQMMNRRNYSIYQITSDGGTIIPQAGAKSGGSLSHG
ncbi:DUF58 domain-containing protein [Bacillus carboniphilus]|uniref:DUF58 domain-containing protein n=2 Tax=Bacillus carboniphilus TaxID=86663 RepID=A0ABP3FQA5_9BACI